MLERPDIGASEIIDFTLLNLNYSHDDGNRVDCPRNGASAETD